MKIDIVSDTICPWCFVGKRRLEAALAQRPDLDVEVVWHPFQLNPATPKDGVDRKQYLREKFGGDTYPDGMLAAITEAGETTGIGFRFGDMNRVPNTVDSHRVIHWAGEQGAQDAVVESLFRRYFLDGEDIGTVDTLVAAAEEAGLDGDAVRARLASDADDERIRSEARRAGEMGISGVPTFIFDSRYAVSGAQPPEVFLQVFDKIAALERETATASAAGDD